MIIPVFLFLCCRRIDLKKNAKGKQETKSHDERLEERLEEEGGFNHKGNQPFPMGGKKKNPIWQSRTIKRGCLLKRGLSLL